jgi:hypothetical protein
MVCGSIGELNLDKERSEKVAILARKKRETAATSMICTNIMSRFLYRGRSTCNLFI